MSENIEHPVLEYNPTEQANVFTQETRLREGTYIWEVSSSSPKPHATGEKAGMLGITYRCTVIDPDNMQRNNRFRAILYVSIPLPHPDVPDYKVKRWQTENFGRAADTFFQDDVPATPRKVQGVWMQGEFQINPTEVDQAKGLRGLALNRMAVVLWNDPDKILGERFYGDLTYSDDGFVGINNPSRELSPKKELVASEDFEEVVGLEVDMAELVEAEND